jgi:hypothetical protein
LTKKSKKKGKKEKFHVLVIGRFLLLLPNDFFRHSRFALGPSFGSWCLSVDSVYIGLPLFTDYVYIGSLLFVDLRGLFTQLWSPFADSVYIGSPLYIDSCGFFRRL